MKRRREKRLMRFLKPHQPLFHHGFLTAVQCAECFSSTGSILLLSHACSSVRDTLHKCACFSLAALGVFRWIHPTLFCCSPLWECKEILRRRTVEPFAIGPSAERVLRFYSSLLRSHITFLQEQQSLSATRIHYLLAAIALLTRQ